MRKSFTKLLKLTLLVMVMVGFGTINSYGQVYKDGVLQGTIRIKIKPTIASSVQTQSLKKGMVNTGIQALDKLNQTYSVTEMKRVFPYSPKYEGRHMEHGLHLWYELTVTAKTASTDVVKAYSDLQEVEIAESIHEITLVDGSGKPTYVTLPAEHTANEYFNDPYLKKQWHYNNTGQSGGTPGADINLYNAWGITKGTPNVVISIVDQGVDFKHEDLADMMWVNEVEENGTPGIDDDGNGFIDDINGFNFNNNSGTIEIGAHGTHVGGTIAAKNNNGIGVCGVAGGTGVGDGVRIMTCQIFGGTHAANTPLTYIYAADNGAVISQNSWGYTYAGYSDQAVNDAIDYFIAEAGNFPGSPMKGGVVIFAAGNSNTEEKMYPAAYPAVISVAALDAFATRPIYSNYGTWVTIAAPGGDAEDNGLPGSNNNYLNGIMSTMDKNGYGYQDGTSMACPHVSGVAGLVVSQYGGPDFTNTALKNHIISGVRDIYHIEANKPYTGKLGSGEIDAMLALANDNKIAPNKTTDLKLDGIAQDFASLSWKVPADNDDGQPLHFEVIYSEKEINDANLPFAKIITIKNSSPAGTPVNYEVQNLKSVTKYHFAIRSIDRWENISDFSNQITDTTNSGPVASFDPLKQALNIVINVNQNTLGRDSIKLLNNGEGILIWDALPRHKDAQPLSNRPALNYPALAEVSSSPKGIMSSIISPDILNNIQHDTLIGKSYVNQDVKLMVFGETNVKIPNSEATRFYISEDAGFNLTVIGAYLEHDETTGPVILEIYEGYNITDAKLLLAQEVNETPLHAYTEITLHEQLFFTKGKYFWVVLHVPAGNKFPLGGGLELSPENSKNCYISLNGGSSWKLFEDVYHDNQVVWAVFAMSTSVNLDQYIILDPLSGKVSPQKDTTIVATVNASNMINGSYKANLVVNTNETGKPMIRVPVNIVINGHRPNITSEGRAHFGDILVGTYKDIKVTFQNKGLGRFTFKSPQIIIDNPQFTSLTGVPQNFEAATSLNLMFRYTATNAGNNYCKVTLVGENGETYKFELFGSGIEPPVVKINPQTAKYTNLAIGDSIKGHFTIKNAGKYPLDYYMPSFANGSNMESIPANIHKFGYSVKTDTTGSSYVWNDISANGIDVTSMFSGNKNTNIFKKFPLTFLFPFFGKNENFVYITKYGLVSFDEYGYLWASQPISYKNEGNPDRYISAGGFPMLLEDAGIGKIYYKQEPDKFIVQYDNVPFWDGLAYIDGVELPYKVSMTFQIILKDNGNISMYYKANTVPNSYTNSNLVSIEDQSKEDGILINGYEWHKWEGEPTGNLTFKPGTAIHIANPGLGLFSNISKPYGTIMPNDSSRITYTIKTDSLYVLPYAENLVIVTNDPFTNPSIHTAEFNIVSGGISNIKTDSTELNFGTLFKGTKKSLSFLVTNKGKASDSLMTAVFDNNYFTLAGDFPVLLKPERSLQYAVTAKTQIVGNYTDTLRLITKNGQFLKIGLSLEVIQGPVITLLNPSGTQLKTVTRFLNAGDNSTVNFKISNTGSVDLHVAPANNDWAIISEVDPSQNEGNVMYRWKKSTDFGGPVYNWVELAGEGGTKITTVQPVSGNDWSEGIKMPFPFSFYGTEYDSLYIGNGLVTFTPNQYRGTTFWGGGPIPDTAQPNNYIAPLWLFGGPDMVSQYPNTGIYYQLFDDRVVVEYRDFNSNFSMGPPVSFEIVLYKNGNIKFQYKMIENWADNSVTDVATIGIENADGTDGVMISDHQKVVNSDMAITLYPARMYTVTPTQIKDFKMLLDAKDLVEGSYADSIAFTNNDPVALELALPTKMVVTGMPQILAPEPVVFDTVLVNPAVPTVSREFKIKNSGTANFTLTGVTQLIPNDVKVEIYELVNNQWKWTILNNFIFPVTVTSNSEVKFRATVTPLVPEVLLDTLFLITSLTPANYKIPITANIYTPAVISLDADTIWYYAQTNSFTTPHSLKIGNETGGFNLNYSLNLLFQRDIPESLSTNNPVNVTQTNAVRKVDTLIAMVPMGIRTLSTKTIKSNTNAEAYNRILAFDSDTVNVTKLGYKGTKAFYTATGFVAPANGFLLSHLQTWFVPGEWLNSKTKIIVLAGDDDINNCKTLLSESLEHDVTQPDDEGSMLTYKLSHSVDINPNEKFFIVFGYEAALTYPQGCAKKTEIVKNRFLFGEPGDWNDIALFSQFDKIGWMTRAIEETAGDVPWVMLTSATTGIVEPAHTDSIHLTFTARTAENADNIAYLVIQSNDIVNPEKRIVLRLTKNNGPVFEKNVLPLVVSENDSIAFQVSSSDLEGDKFIMTVDSTYQFLNSVKYTDPDPKVKTLKFIYKPDFKSQGVHTFGFTGTDEYNNVSKSTVTVTVKNVNRIPEPIAVDTMKFAMQGAYKIVDASDLFVDPDDDMEKLEAATGDAQIVDLFVSGNSFLLMPLEAGVTSVTFMVTDKYGAKATNTVPVLVSEEVTGIDNVESKNFIVYPNPTRGEVNVIMPSDLNGRVALSIYNVQGKVVKDEIFKANAVNKFLLNLTDLPAGIYFLKWNSNQLQKTSKISKQ